MYRPEGRLAVRALRLSAQPDLRLQVTQNARYVVQKVAGVGLVVSISTILLLSNLPTTLKCGRSQPHAETGVFCFRFSAVYLNSATV